jgi:hypothetical protein
MLRTRGRLKTMAIMGLKAGWGTSPHASVARMRSGTLLLSQLQKPAPHVVLEHEYGEQGCSDCAIAAEAMANAEPHYVEEEIP